MGRCHEPHGIGENRYKVRRANLTFIGMKYALLVEGERIIGTIPIIDYIQALYGVISPILKDYGP